MKRIVFALAGAALLAAALAGCSNSSDGGAGIGLANGITSATNGGSSADGSNTGVQPGGGATGGTPDVLINASNLVYIGEVTETVDSVEYKVKKYADVLVDNPYFYTYYKVYYLNDKVRRVYKFDHGAGHDMDYKYDEFVEHDCGENYLRTGTKQLPDIYTYYENGKIEDFYYTNYTSDDIETNIYFAPQHRCHYHFDYYENGNKKNYEIYHNDLKERSFTYYENGKTKEKINYSNGVKYTSYTYYENGKEEYDITYTNGVESNKRYYTYYDNGELKESTTYTNGVEASKIYYTYSYYDNGKMKEWTTYTNGAITGYSSYYENGQKKQWDTYTGTTKTSSSFYYENGKTKLSVNYNNGDIFSFYCQYESGYYKHYYSYGKFYTYLENKKLTSVSTNSSDYSSCEDFTPEQAAAKVEELKNN